MQETSLECIGNKRYLLAILTCFGLTIAYAMRCEFGIAIIKMTELKSLNVSLQSNNYSNPWQTIQKREVTWSHIKISFVQASFFIGYAMFSIPGGFLTTIFPPNIMFGCAMFISASLNLLIPTLIRHPSGFYGVFVFRVMQGMAEGCLYPSIHSFWRYWAPKQERSKLVTISFFGVAIGPVIGYPISGILIKRFSWSTNFYFWSIIAFVWTFLWFLIVRSCPSKDTCISESEKLYIEKNTYQLKIKASDVPWLGIVSSIPVWAIIIANIGRNWTHQFAFSGLPSFLRKKFRISSMDLGFHMSAPYLLMAIVTPIGGVLADFMIKRKYSITFVRRLFNSIGFGTGGMCFLALGFIPNMWLASATMTLGLGAFGIGLSGYAVNHLDVADIYAGFLMGISNGLGTIAGIISPIVAIQVTRIYPGVHGWQIYFLISGTIHLSTTLFFAIFSSGENQPWSKHIIKEDSEEEEKQKIIEAEH